MKVDGSIHSLIQGISQQPAKKRLMGQCTLQENCSSNPVDGLVRRPPTSYVAALTPSADVPNAIYYDFTIKGTDYLLLIADSDAKVFDLEGTEYPCTLGYRAAEYITASSLSFTTIGYDTYIANPDVTVRMLPDTKVYDDKATILHLLGGQYGRDYKVTVMWGANTQTFSYTTPNGAASADITKVATTYIATQLETAFNANGTLTAVFSITRVGDHLLIESTDASSAVFTCTTDDGDGGSRLYVTNNTVVDVGKLPKYAPQGYYVSVTGSGSAAVDDYYLVFTIDDDTVNTGDGFGTQGIWKEMSKEGIPYVLDLETMPYILTYDPDHETFALEQGDWKGRQVGDEITNEDPSFVNDTIRSISQFQGRLVFLSGENQIMSITNEPLDFWRKTATAQTATDAIDQKSTTKSSILQHAIPFNRDLITFGVLAQFVTFGRQALTPTNSSLVLTTEFESDKTVQPVIAGKNIFYAVNQDNFCQIREFFNDSQVDANDARPITQHVPKLLAGRCLQLSSSTSFDILTVRTDADKSKIYVYEYIWIDNQKKQSSWSPWQFAEDVEYIFFRESNMYLVTHHLENISLEVMPLNVADTDGLNYPVMLDSRMEIAGAESIDNIFADNDTLVIVQGEGCPHPGLLAQIDTITDDTITFDEDYTGGTLIIGDKYTSRYIPTPPFVKDQNEVNIGTGKLVVSKYIVNFTDTGYFQYQITSPYLDTFTDYFSGVVLNSPESLIGEASILDGSYIIPFREPVDLATLEINSDSHLPFKITDLEWKGQYTKRGKRITGGA